MPTVRLPYGSTIIMEFLVCGNLCRNSRNSHLDTPDLNPVNYSTESVTITVMLNSVTMAQVPIWYRRVDNGVLYEQWNTH